MTRLRLALTNLRIAATRDFCIPISLGGFVEWTQLRMTEGPDGDTFSIGYWLSEGTQEEAINELNKILLNSTSPTKADYNKLLAPYIVAAGK